MAHKTINTEQGHWLLAKMGKKVLRPGGKELTLKLVDALKLETTDKIIEFAPGIGFTAEVLINQNPLHYTGVEINEEAAAKLRHKFRGLNCDIVTASASQSGLATDSCDKLIAEAMLTMQADHRKEEIIREAYRLLKPGGLYAIHELCLIPEDLPEEQKDEIRQTLAKTMHVNARPLTKLEWAKLFEKEGFKIKKVFTSPLHILERKRLIEDEGWWGAAKIGFNVLTHPKAKEKILEIKSLFKYYQNHLTAFGFILEKN